MKVKELMKQLKQFDEETEIKIHDFHQIYNIVALQTDFVLGNECIAIIVDRFSQQEGVIK